MGNVPDKRKRPDARPMRLAYGAGALAALSVMSVGLVPFKPAAQTTELAIADPAPSRPPTEVRHVVRYVHLRPGETAPPGATVITPEAPAPQVIVTQVAAPAPQPRQVVVVTRQSGRP